MTVRSEIDVGTIFEFYLPASKGRIVAKAEEARVVAKAEEEKKLSVGTGRILLVDDEEVIHQVVGKMLETLGYEVDGVYDGDRALQAYRTALETDKPFDVVITDLTIPGAMGGREVVGKLHGIDPQARVIVSSGYAHDPVMNNFVDYGFAGRVMKPVEVSELADTVESVLAKAIEFDKDSKTDPEETKAGYTVLLVDDDEAILNPLSQILADMGYIVMTAEDGESAVEIFRKRYPEIDGVVLDYSLPRMDGRDVFVKMQEIDHNVQALLATGHGYSEEVRQLLDLGVGGLLEKPYEIKALIQELEELVA